MALIIPSTLIPHSDGLSGTLTVMGAGTIRLSAQDLRDVGATGDVAVTITSPMGHPDSDEYARQVTTTNYALAQAIETLAKSISKVVDPLFPADLEQVARACANLRAAMILP